MSATKIEWATHTENYLAGCTKVSPACTHCYAESMTARLATMPNAPDRYRDGVVDGKRWTGRVMYSPERLRAMFDGLRGARSPRRVFVNSMSDTFHAAAPPESLEDLAYGIRAVEAVRRVHGAAPHVLMLLTKRPGNARAWQRKHFPEGLPSWVWIGCTVENQEAAAERIPVLCDIAVKPGGVRFLSCEPLLGPIRFADVPGFNRAGSAGQDIVQHLWVIAGGESGPKARPSHPDWFRSLRDQCAVAAVPFHFKQWGEWIYESAVVDPEERCLQYATVGGAYVVRVGKKAAGRLLDGVEHNGVPGVSP